METIYLILKFALLLGCIVLPLFKKSPRNKRPVVQELSAYRVTADGFLIDTCPQPVNAHAAHELPENQRLFVTLLYFKNVLCN